jgi:hypothetical protein
MTAFDDASKVEKAALFDLLPYCKWWSAETGFRDTQHQLMLQKYAGDLLIPTPSGAEFIELKAEAEDKHGNLFLETWSNRSCFTPGWMITSKADWLWYYFVKERKLIHMKLTELKQWAFGGNEDQGAIYFFEERKQNKYNQRNDTWGRIVPYSHLATAIEIPSFYGPFEPKPGAE